MKKTVFMCAFALITGNLAAQKIEEANVPSTIKTTFAKSFPNVKGVKWSKEKEGEFEAEFKNGGVEQSANFDETGKWLVTETKINKKDLPLAVQDALKKEFAGYKIEEATKIESLKNGSCFEAEIEKGKETFDVLLTADGKLLSKTKVEEEKDKEKGEKD